MLFNLTFRVADWPNLQTTEVVVMSHFLNGSVFVLALNMQHLPQGWY